MSAEMDLTDVRREYESQGITRKDMDSDPFVQFGHWMQRARDLELLDATAMTLAEKMEEARTVLASKKVADDGRRIDECEHVVRLVDAIAGTLAKLDAISG